MVLDDAGAHRPDVLVLAGEYDLRRRDELRAACGTIAGAEAAIVDLTAVSYLDSIALSEFIRLGNAFAARGARLVWVVPPGGTPLRIITIARLDRWFTIAGTLAEAHQALSG